MQNPGSNLFMVDLEGTTLSDSERVLLKHRHVGAVILFTRNFTNSAQLELLIADIRKSNPSLFITVDHEGGNVQRFQRQGFQSIPAARAYGIAYNIDPETGMQLAKHYGETMAQDLLVHGVDLSLAPIIDLDNNSPVISKLDRAFHASPDGVKELAGAFIEGMKKAGMPSVGKHFPGHGSVTSDSHIAMPVSHASLDELKATDLKPFIELINQGLLNALMPAHVTYTKVDPNKPAGFSKIWLQDILRSQLGFKGLVLSDCLSMKGADIGDLKTRAEEALNAGCDMLIVCHQPRELLLELLQTITIEQSAESAARITNFKQQLKHFSPTQPPLLNETAEPIILPLKQAEQPASPGAHDQYNKTQSI